MSSSAAAKKPLKGILKQPKKPAAAAQPEENSKQAEARRIAVQHATIIQQQKDIQDEIFRSLVRLLDFPLVRDNNNAEEEGDDDDRTTADVSKPPPGASHPAASDAAEFKRLVRMFQPTDYDDLIEERNIAGSCGYALCPLPRKRIPNAGTWKMVNKGRSDFDIVRTAELEKWCSDDCARRALYVKVQLHETGAWERIGMPELRIDLYGEDGRKQKKKEETTAPPADEKLAEDIGRLRIEEERKAATEESKTLALERGDTNRKGKESLIDFDIREKKIIKTPKPPSKEQDSDGEDDVHMLLEGHKPR
ncbi:hypothetical protein MAPG_01651 [Magnaporthiopsis poae ATCC 64411]|uniref:RNA polymerase II subunit B1 CTD phosphatase RPAP2 homolog n=1 Tax=Magnaporthiopsis poae (strain ATCC 64411 / 73-15) TaxID=644358 RepID=A0A0C4DP94_MAGP6|nr:hypothetical protein MAPG_01651 [Magnaporthiopsis poae ATCC 64411]